MDILIRAAGSIGGDVTLRLAGTGPAEPELRRMSATMPGVVFEGVMPSAAMPSFFNGLDVFVLPTVGRRGWTEQFGRAAVEAMACGIPTVVANVVVPTGDAHALANALQQLRDDPKRREHMAESGRAHVLERYTTEAVADATAAFYRSIANDES